MACKHGLILLVLLGGMASTGWAATYYLDKKHLSASDSNTGTSAALPWLTVNHAMGLLAAGDHLYIKGGTTQSDPNAIYLQTNFHGLNVTTTGTAGHVITVEGYPGDVVVIKGTEEANHYGIRLTGAVSYYTFKNLVFTLFQVGLNNEFSAAKTNIVIDHCEFSYCKWGSSFSEITGLRVSDTLIHHNFYNGMFIGSCGDVTVERCQSYNNNDGMGGGGDSDGFSSNLVTNLLMVDCHSYDNGEDGFDLQAEGALINCSAHGMGGFGIKSWRRPNDSYVNHPLSLINCLVYDNDASGVLLANGNETHFYNCTVANNGENGIQASSSLTGQSNIYSTLVNTVLYHNGTGNVYNPITVYDDQGPAAWMVVDCNNNLFFLNDHNTTLIGVNSNTNALYIDPCFVNSSTDFHSQAGGNMIDAGDTSSAMVAAFKTYLGLSTALDYDHTVRPSGASWDLGAYEYDSVVIVPPSVVTTPSPFDTATGVPVAGYLSWAVSEGATGYDVYLDTANPPTVKVSSNQAGLSYAYSGLTVNTVYRWKVVAKNAGGDASATIWSLTTSNAPAKVASPSPTNGATHIGLTTTVSWATASGATSYRIYKNGTLFATQSGLSISLGVLVDKTPCTWRVDSGNTDTWTTGDDWTVTSVSYKILLKTIP